MKNSRVPRSMAEAFGPGAQLYTTDTRAVRRAQWAAAAVCWAVAAVAGYALLASFDLLPWVAR